MSNQNEKNNASTESIYGIIEKNENKSYCFEIPAYQRLYEWGDSQIETLLDDCKKACEKGGAYFVGNVVVAKANEENKYVLIDGQQRLTTLFLIGIYLKSYFESQESQNAKDQESQWKKFLIYKDKKKKEGNLRISMPLREKEEESLKKFIEQSDDFNKRLEILKREQIHQEKKIHQNFIDALQCIGNWFAKKTIEEKLNIEKFSDFLYKKVQFVLVELADTTDLNRFFVRMNNRGKQLEKHEILKARLLSVIQEEESQGTYAKYAKIWDLCSDMDRYIFQRKSDWEISKGDGEYGEKNTINDIIKGGKLKKPQDKSNQQDKERFKSIVDFPTFLLHTAKLYQLEKQGAKAEDLIPIDKDKLLDLICVNDQSADEVRVMIKNAQDAQDFIKTLLKYRILFDYFVIKRNLEKDLENENQYKIGILKQSSKQNQVQTPECYKDLAMVQNYLRVARAGDRQNHHHWLTAFLQKVEGKQKSNLNIDELLEQKNNISIEKLVPKNQEGKNLGELVRFLEEWDTELAKLQLHREQDSSTQQEQEGKIPSLIELNNGLMIELAKLQLHREQDSSTQQEQEGKIPSLIELNKGVKWEFLNRGTATPHYWFYRLEYYLCKKWVRNAFKMEDGGFKFDDEKFSEIIQKYRFRNLNSIEHIQPQSKAKDKWGEEDNIDKFGNLALISTSLNSSLNAHEVNHKFSVLEENEVVSLKMWLVYHMYRKENNENWWNIENAQKHQGQMLKILKESLETKSNSS